MNSYKKPFVLQGAWDAPKRFLLGATITLCLVGWVGPAVAQVGSVTPPENPEEAPSTGVQEFNLFSTTTPVTPRTTGAPSSPPLGPPVSPPLPSGEGKLTFGQWLLSPQLLVDSFYDTNVHSSPTVPLSGPGFHFRPSVIAEYDTGIWYTKLFGNIDSRVYPTLDWHNNTFNRQANIFERYSPLPDLAVTATANYAHSTNASVVQSSLPTPVGSTPPPGAESVVSGEQTVVNPNDVYTLTTNISKQLNRAFVNVGGTLTATRFEMNPSQDFNRKAYFGAGGFWFSPILYAFGDGVQSFNNPETGAPLNTFRARAGIGTGLLGFFSGAVYYGQQGSESAGGKAGGDLYGGLITYLPSPQFNMTLSVSRTRNVSSIASSQFALGGTELSSVPTGVSSSTEITVIALKANMVLSAQTNVLLVLSDTINQSLTTSTVTSDYFASLGIRHKLSNQLTATFNYSFTDFVSPLPNASFTRNLVTVGAVYYF